MCSKHKSDVYEEHKTELAALDTKIGISQTMTPAQEQTLKGILIRSHTAYFNRAQDYDVEIYE
jgi:hypothetical protein